VLTLLRVSGGVGAVVDPDGDPADALRGIDPNGDPAPPGGSVDADGDPADPVRGVDPDGDSGAVELFPMFPQ